MLHFGRAVALLTGSDVNGASWRCVVLSLGSFMLLPRVVLFKKEFCYQAYGDIGFYLQVNARF